LSAGHPIRVVCVGDSITRGQVSVDYVELLRHQFDADEFVFHNAGVNYDLAYSVRRRLDDVVALNPDHVTVLIGTNDANATLHASNLRLLRWMKRPPVRPTASWFRENLIEIVDELQRRTQARIALLSLPVIGEDLDSLPLRRSSEYSQIVREVAAGRAVSYLPLHERQVEHLRARNQSPGTSYRPGLALSGTASTQHFVFRRTLDAISARRGLQFSTDTIHQNSRGAGMIADLIAEHLKAGDPPDRSRQIPPAEAAH
jgi:lysophospholipase L1-like esterase